MCSLLELKKKKKNAAGRQNAVPIPFAFVIIYVQSASTFGNEFVRSRYL